MRIPSQQYTEVIEPSNYSLKLHTVYQKNGYRRFVFTDVIQKYILDIL